MTTYINLSDYSDLVQFGILAGGVLTVTNSVTLAPNTSYYSPAITGSGTISPGTVNTTISATALTELNTLKNNITTATGLMQSITFSGESDLSFIPNKKYIGLDATSAFTGKTLTFTGNNTDQFFITNNNVGGGFAFTDSSFVLVGGVSPSNIFWVCTNFTATNTSVPGVIISNVFSGTVSASPPRVYNGRIYSTDDMTLTSNGPDKFTVFSPTPTPPPQRYTVTYNGNGNTNQPTTNVPVDNLTYATGNSVTILDKGPLSKVTYDFAGWNTAANGSGTPRVAGGSFTMGTANVTLYAQWTETPVVCYAKGSLMLTKQGFVPIEHIKAGDTIVTKGKIHDNKTVKHEDLAVESVVWISKFTLSDLNSKSRPICITKNALGKNSPFKELYVSPEHRLIINNKMIKAKHMVNNTTIYQDMECKEVEYYHLECEKHSAIFANGVLSESYTDDNNRYVFEPSDKLQTIPPKTILTPVKHTLSKIKH